MLGNRFTAFFRLSSWMGFRLALPVLLLMLAPAIANAACDCPHVGDVDGDGASNVLDMVKTLDYIINSGPGPTTDPLCPVAREDFNADGIVDIRDVAEIRYYFFQGGAPLIDPCDCESTPALCQALNDPTPGEPGNSLVVESKNAVGGATGVRIGISISNDVALEGLLVPLVAREITPGSFITSATMLVEDRLQAAGLEIHQFNQYANADGSCPNGFGTVTASDINIPHAVAASPEGFVFYNQVLSNKNLAPGSDVSGSLVLLVDVTAVEGTFEIDTTCIGPNGHLLFLQNDPGTDTPIIPSFTKGIITIVANTPPVALCQDVTVAVDNSCSDVDVSIDNGSYDPDGGDVIVTQDPPGPYGLGSTLVTLTAEDDAGATSQCQATVTVEDATPPEITCPADIFLNIPPIYSGWVIAYQVTATDNCPGDVTITSTNPSGGFFPNGVTEVTCTATDESGNSAECTFLVSIEAVCYDRLSDVNCDGQTDALDLGMLIDILFGGAAEAPPCSNGPQ